MKLNKKEDQSVGASVLLIKGNKVITGRSGSKGFERERRRQQYQVWE